MSLEASQLLVIFEGEIVGTIRLDNQNKMNFQYSANWIQAPHSFAISHSLPLSLITYTFATGNYRKIFRFAYRKI